MREKKKNKVIKYIFIVSLVLVFTYLILGELLLPADDLGDVGSMEEYSGTWERVLPDGHRIPQSIPGRCEAEKNEVVIVETKLPTEISEDTYLCFRSAKQDMEIYVDGEMRQKYSTEDTRLFGKISAAAYLFLPIHSEDAGKVLRLKTQTDSSYSGIFYSVFVGGRMEIWQSFYKQYGMELLVAFLLLMLSAVTIMGSILIRVRYHRKLSLEYLAWGVLMASMWLISNSIFRQLIFPNVSVINDIAFFMTMLLPIPFLIYMNGIQKGRYQRGYGIAEMITVINFVNCAGLHMTKLLDFTNTISYISIVAILAIIYMLITILIDIYKGFVKEYILVAIGIFLAFLAATLQIIMYFQRTNMFNGVILAAGLIFLLLFDILNTIREIVAMERQKQKALSASEQKDRFLANMSHEIRTPINAVLGMDAMILRESKEEKTREYAMDIQNAGQVLLSLINDILDLSKIESGKMEILPVEYDFSSLLHDVMNMVSMKAETKNLAVHLRVDDHLPSRLYGDDIRLRQILVNLMNNAVKYTEKGSVTLSVKGTVKESGLVLRCEVKDTGIGIKEQDISRLFQEFERIEEDRNRNVEGTGLGMSITVKLLQLMGSKLQVESVYGEGSTFFFEVEQGIVGEEPIGNLEERIRNQNAEYSYQVPFVAPDANLLVVDDNAINRRVFINLLKDTKANIEEATGGLECLDKVSGKHYDIIFLDHMMPDLDGVETLHRLREQKDSPCKDTPVIALTANAIMGAKEMYLSEGFFDYLSKPIRPEKLESLILECIPKEKIRQEEFSAGGEEEKQELPEIEGIDWKYALLYMKDVTLLKDTVHHFFKMAAGERQTLESFWQLLSETDSEEERKEGYRQYRVKVHSMKSSAAMLGALTLSAIAKLLEFAARDEKMDVIRRLHPVLIDEWSRMEKNLGELFPGESVEKAAPDYKQILEYLPLLKSAMEEMDIDTADEIWEKLDNYLYPAGMTLIVEKLRISVQNIDAEQVKEYADQLEERIRKL